MHLSLTTAQIMLEQLGGSECPGDMRQRAGTASLTRAADRPKIRQSDWCARTRCYTISRPTGTNDTQLVGRTGNRAQIAPRTAVAAVSVRRTKEPSETAT